MHRRDPHVSTHPTLAVVLELDLPRVSPALRESLDRVVDDVWRDVYHVANPITPGARVMRAGPRIVRAAPIGQPGTLPFWETLTLVHLLARLAVRGVFSRGVVSLGAGSSSPDALGGAVLERAERLLAITGEWPRVVLDPDLLSAIELEPALRADHHDVVDELGYIQRLVRCGDDGLWSVDYLRAIRGESESMDEYRAFLEQHKAAIIERGVPASGEPTGLVSRGYLCRWHNQVIDELVSDAGAEGPAPWSMLRINGQGLAYEFPSGALERAV